MNSTNAMKRVEYGYVSHTEQVIIEELTREEKRMQAVIYVRPGCQKCRHTILKLEQVMPVQTITADADDYERFRRQGYRSMPVVTIYKADGTHDEWCDLQVDKIKEYTED
ncbi:thioredoxin domain-containing protein [Lacticaseibacillus paracasei]|uniref:ribonucleoside-diphosphate reductase n=1 Tax=Lacticaseibacillus paracasei TaxID=1597 RepID=UPI002A59EA36|nr:ribonucleoside-diphosphate reductase [Lacticaseibacillus paracasei]MDY0839008.1 ribonucleoside-diphosphate reductase [Lacticaseibacillus paracasei]